MSASYKSISWNTQKKTYDGVIVLFVVVYLGTYIGITLLRNPQVTQEALLIRSTATLALLLLHVILIIGPLTRLNAAFLPLLYNRRHLGVTLFCVAATHGIFSIIQFHSLGNINALASVFTSNTHYESLSRFPFEVLGFIALVIFFFMAITSHDFWLNQLGPRIWKTLHMLVYVAYALVIAHVLLGVVQYETSPVLFISLAIGLITICMLHLIASQQERNDDLQPPLDDFQNFVKVCDVNDIRNNRAKVVRLGEERIAIFRYDGKIAAVSNVCKHQHGPLGEGRVINGCITCPWHGYQYLPHNGTSPPPFKEKVNTYEVIVTNNEVWVNPSSGKEGTERHPVEIQNQKAHTALV